MKKIMLVAVLLLTVFTTYGQFNFGIKAGYNSSIGLSNIGDIANGTYNLTNLQNEMWNDFHAGLFSRIFVGKSVYIEPELLYAVQKKNYQLTLQDAVSGSVTLDKVANISTVDVPILVGLKLLDLKILNVRAFAGPKLRFNAGSTLDFKNVTGGTFDTNKLLTDIKAADLGLEAGAGIDVLMFALDFRMNLIGDMYTTKLDSKTINNLSSSKFVISLGWKLF